MLKVCWSSVQFSFFPSLYSGIPGIDDLGDFLGIPGMPAIPRKLLRPTLAVRDADKAKSVLPSLSFPGTRSN